MTLNQTLDRYLHAPGPRIAMLAVLVVALVALGWFLHPDIQPTPRAQPVVAVTPVPGPVVTVTAPPKIIRHTVIKKVPGPTRTVIKYVSRSTTRAPIASHTAPGGVAACIRKWESGGDYTAQNPSSTASGAYQFLDTTWQAVTGLSGSAKNYSPATQDAAFVKLWAGGTGRNQWVTEYHC